MQNFLIDEHIKRANLDLTVRLLPRDLEVIGSNHENSLFAYGGKAVSFVLPRPCRVGVSCVRITCMYTLKDPYAYFFSNQGKIYVSNFSPSVCVDSEMHTIWCFTNLARSSIQGWLRP